MSSASQFRNQVSYVPSQQRTQNENKKNQQQQKNQQQSGAPKAQKQKAKAAMIEFPSDCLEVEYMDSHTHLFKIFEDLKCDSFESFSQKEELNQHCKYGGCINVNCWADGWKRGLQLQFETRKNNNKNKIYSTYGLHPNQSHQWDQKWEQELRKCLSEPDTVAIGETGLDYFRMTTPKEKQHFVFRTHLKLALEYKKPVVVHTRDAEEDTIQILKEELPQDWLIHIHCFTGTTNFIQQIKAHFSNAFFGFTGVVTFQTGIEQYRTLVREVGLEKLLIETDGPYMAPVPFRGKSAHPGHIPYTALQMASSLDLPLAQVLTQTVKNTKTVYQIQS